MLFQSTPPQVILNVQAAHEPLTWTLTSGSLPRGTTSPFQMNSANCLKVFPLYNTEISYSSLGK